MAEENFEEFVQRERGRLNSEREAIFAQQRELEKKLADIDREFAAIEAYEAAKSGRTPARTKSRSEEHTSELQSLTNLVCRLLLEKKKRKNYKTTSTGTK